MESLVAVAVKRLLSRSDRGNQGNPAFRYPEVAQLTRKRSFQNVGEWWKTVAEGSFGKEKELRDA
jgi:hypothetical protein